jgi:ATP-binding cassette, subfamily B, bacterial
MRHPSSLRAITTRHERSRLTWLAAASCAAGLADATSLVAISACAVAVTSSAHRVDVGPLTLVPGAALVVATAATIARLGIGAWIARQQAAVAASIMHRHRRTVVASFVAAAWSTSSAQPPGSVQHLALVNTQVAGAHALTWATGLAAAANIAVLGLVAVALDPVAALAVAMMGCGVAIIMRPLVRRSRSVGELEAGLARGLATEVSNVVTGDLPTKLLHVGTAVDRGFSTASDAHAGVYRRGRFLGAVSPVVFQTVVSLLTIGVLALLVRIDTSDAAAIGAIALLALRGLSNGHVVQQSAQTLEAQRGFIDDLLRSESELAAAPVVSGSEPVPEISSIQLEAVTVTWPSSRFALGPIDVTIGRHEFLGVDGPSGAGKSTLLEVLSGLRVPTAGRLLVNGVDTTSFDRASWAERFAVVPQEPILIAGSVASNICWFRTFSQAEIVAAARAAGLASEIDAWPRGLDTAVGEHGSELSVGQRQRVCLARALVGSPEVLLLDEATSALDPASEECIRVALEALRGKVTAVIIAHRPATLSLCDRVITIDGGHLIGATAHR